MSAVKKSNGKKENADRSFNLVTEPWIPVLDINGKQHLVSLLELYEKANEWADLAVGPLETIALFRLFIAITQRALDGPKNREEWETSGERLIAASLEYLNRWKARFDLFGDNPFLQIKSLTSNNRSKTDKLDFALATGNSNTLFDQGSVEDGRMHSPSWLALNLLVYLSFSPGGRIGVAQWRGKATEGDGSSNNSPCMESNMLFTLLMGKNLSESIRWNLIPFDHLPFIPGKPIWEYDIDRITDKDKQAIVRSWYGRLVPLARFICLATNGQDMILSNGLSFPVLPEIREPMGAIFVRLNKNKIDWKYVRTDPNQHPWRNLCAILAHIKRDEAGSSGGAYALENIPFIAKSKDGRGSYELWIGGVASNKAKIIDTAYWTVQINTGLLGSLALKNYENGVKLAHGAGGRLIQAVKTYCDHLKLEPEKEALKNVSSLVVRAKSLYWSALDKQYSILLDESQKDDGMLNCWRDILKKEIVVAYSQVCSHRTDRQLQAFAEGMRQLYRSGKMAKKCEKEGESAVIPPDDGTLQIKSTKTSKKK